MRKVYYEVANDASGEKSIYEKMWKIIMTITLFYAFFFQYGIMNINNMMLLLCAFDIVFAIFYIFAVSKGRIQKSLFFNIILFVLIAFIAGCFITSNGDYSFNVGIRMIEYVLTAYSLFLLIKLNEQYFFYFLSVIVLSITLLALVVILKGVAVTSVGALGIQNLNVNVMSSYFILMMACSFILFGKSKNIIRRIVLIIADSIVIIAQIGAASRRGFIIIIALVFMGLVFGLIPFFSRRRSTKRFIYYTLLIALLCFAVVLFRDYILNSTILGTRLSGNLDTGDLARQRYQEFALQQFKSKPLMGIGVGGVAFYVGVYSHSLYYEVLSCTGIVGAILLIGSLSMIGFKLYKKYRKTKYYQINKGPRLLSIIGFIYWLSIVVSGYSVVMIYDFDFYVSIAILIAIIEMKLSW